MPFQVGFPIHPCPALFYYILFIKINSSRGRGCGFVDKQRNIQYRRHAAVFGVCEYHNTRTLINYGFIPMGEQNF
jgi:hypothetical protein